MHCRTCGYALWNLSRNTCPECGTEFDLRSYQFEPGSVIFACPLCDHRYQGHGPNYLPSDSEEVECLQCHQHVATAMFRAIPLKPDAMARDPQRVPWEHRQFLGFWQAWWQTWKLSCFSPGALGRHLGDGGSWLPALGFAALTHGLASLSSVAFAILFLIVAMFAQGGGGGGISWFNSLPLFAGWFFTLVWMVLSIMAAHAVVMFTGPRRGGWRLTARSLCYAQGPHLLAAIPFASCLPFMGWIWYAISGTLVLSEAQKIATWRALLATAGLTLMAIFGLIVLAFVLISRI